MLSHAEYMKFTLYTYSVTCCSEEKQNIDAVLSSHVYPI